MALTKVKGSVWDAGENEYTPAGTGAVATTVKIALDALRSTAYIADSTVTDAYILQSLGFLTNSLQDTRGDSFLSGERRKIRRYYTTQADLIPREYVPDEHSNATAMAKAGRALVGAFNAYRQERYLTTARRFAEKILGLQWLNAGTARYGGIKLGENATQASAFTASLSGEFLLDLYAVDPDPRWAQACVLIGDFLKVLNDPNTTYVSLYSETPITQPTRNGFTWGGLCDQIDSADVISVTHTTWNLIAVPFLQRLGTLTGDSTYTTLATTVLAFGDTGVASGYDFFAVYNPSPGAHIEVEWPTSTGYGFVGDHQWHRQGEETMAGSTEIVTGNTATAGAAASITFQAGSSAVDDFYNGYVVKVTAGTGSGQTRVVSDYVGSTLVATVGRVWDINPDATSVYSIGLAANTIGTDQIEYGMVAMLEGGSSVATITAYYNTYKGYAHADVGATDFGTSYDGAKSFPGFFRMFLAGPKGYGSYYDAQGALLYLKHTINSADYLTAVSVFYGMVDNGALLDENLGKVWSGTTPDFFVTDGTIPHAVSLIDLFKINGSL
jgi:hypothetical protein